MSQNGFDILYSFLTNYNSMENENISKENCEFSVLIEDHSTLVLEIVLWIIDSEARKNENF